MLAACNPRQLLRGKPVGHDGRIDHENSSGTRIVADDIRFKASLMTSSSPVVPLRGMLGRVGGLFLRRYERLRPNPPALPFQETPDGLNHAFVTHDSLPMSSPALLKHMCKRIRVGAVPTLRQGGPSIRSLLSRLADRRLQNPSPHVYSTHVLSPSQSGRQLVDPPAAFRCLSSWCQSPSVNRSH